jgi:uncharacterized protein (DUF362 family)
MKIERRDFLKNSMFAGLATGAGLAMGSFDNVWGNVASDFSNPFDMVAVKGGEAEAMFEKAIASLGGMKAFVKKNQTVVVKPNIGWDVVPEKAANTNPKLVAKIVEHCLQAGAKDVYVFDNTCDNWQKCYTNSGIEKAVKDAGGKIVSGKSESYYHQVQVPKGVKLKEAKVHELIINSDVFINVPVLKCHGGATLTVSMKNLMGVVWDRGFWHKTDLHQCIADFATYRKPDLNIVDAYRVMKKNGPRGVSVEDIVTMKAQIISKDMVAADAAATKLYGLDPKNIGFITQAEKLGVGTSNLEKLNINRIKV